MKCVSHALFALFLLLAVPSLHAQDRSADDAETKELKTLNDHFPFVVPDSLEAWKERSEKLRTRVLVATGLWPLPEKTPLNATIHDRVERDGFVTEKVYFESFPGHHVTGMLFRPAADNTYGVDNGKRPGVLCPHGHGGRLLRYDDDELDELIKSGGEKHRGSGRSPRYARCAHLARMGCVTLVFDMLGYADSQQVSYQVAHRHAKSRPEENDRSQPCLFSIDADLNLQSVMGWQTWNAVRALDFLASLPDVDSERLGVTGGSGGGTQTILLGAIDPRVKVSFPNGMVSTSMQGGCYCENCNYLRVGTGNVELAALLSPRPQGMTAAEDWTRDMMTDGYPQLKELYGLWGVPENVMCRSLLQFPHNYNYVTRATMYPWMAKHLGLPDDAPLVEEDAVLPPDEDLRVWNADHPMPSEIGLEHERRVLAWWNDQSDQILSASIPESDDGSLESFKRLFGKAWHVMLDVPPVQQDLDKTKRISVLPAGEPVGTVIHCGNDQTTVGEVQPWLDQGFEVIFPLANREGGLATQPLVQNNKSYSAFTFGYNPTEFALRVDVLVQAIREKAIDGRQVQVHGDSEGAALAAAAAMICGDLVDACIIEPDGFRFANVEHYSDANFVPGAAKYGDLPALIALRAPHPLTVIGADESVLAVVRAAYAAADAEHQLTIE